MRPCPPPASPRPCSRPAQFAEFIQHAAACTTACSRRGPPGGTASDIAALFPDEDWLDRVTREAPRLAPEYFTTPLPVPRGWEARPAAYLAFGDTYAAELAFAERRRLGGAPGGAATTCPTSPSPTAWPSSSSTSRTGWAELADAPVVGRVAATEVGA